ncbi:hypothetical protein KKA14_19440, partial [bacterium]|nr:hypothetical protein [bacterium]
MSEFPSIQISEEFDEELLSLFKKKYNTDEFSLIERKSNYIKFFISSYESFRNEAAEIVLVSENSEDIIHCHSFWMDSWIRFTWLFVNEEETILMREVLRSSKQKLKYLKNSLPQKKKKLGELEKYLIAENTEPFRMDPAERSYYESMREDQVKEMDDLRRELEILEEIVPLIPNENVDGKKLLDILLIFARGGYGRRELTFSSDIDLGYCINASAATKLEFQTVQELIKRMEELFQGLPLDIAAQYFELAEDLSRFAKTTMLHTIPSILEGREILGKTDNLKTLKEQILKVCPLEKMIRYLKSQMDNLEDQGNNTFFIKMGFGGIRHLQFVLWMVLIVIKHESGNSRFLLALLRVNGWISKNDEINLLQALEFYFDLRNFFGLYSYYEEKLEYIGSGDLAKQGGKNKDFLDDQSCTAYLKLKQRFTTIDDMDRFRLYSIRTISEQAQAIVRNMLDRTIVENLSGFCLCKHLGTNKIIRFQFKEEKTYPSWNLKVYSEELKRHEEKLTSKDIKKLFSNFDNLFDLFRYIGNTGNCLSLELRNDLAELIPDLEKVDKSKHSEQIRKFIFDLFTCENSSVVVKQMMDIATPLNRKGNVLTLFGVFLPEVNKMRYLLRNLDIHEYPLCIHSLKSLEQVEKEIDVFEKNEPELWRYIGDDDIFALKWSTFFHDVGKINPYRDHEEYGPIVSAEMLFRLGWKEDSGVLDLIRLLISNHQSVVRYSQLSTYLDLGIIKFFELAQRDPRKVVLLYLLNLSDFKSVNSEMNKKAAHLENFFEKTMSILGEFSREQQTGSVREIVNNYLDRMKDEIRISVFLELL